MELTQKVLLARDYVRVVFRYAVPTRYNDRENFQCRSGYTFPPLGAQGVAETSGESGAKRRQESATSGRLKFVSGPSRR